MPATILWAIVAAWFVLVGIALVELWRGRPRPRPRIKPH
jgi:hypothetical protein